MKSYIMFSYLLITNELKINKALLFMVSLILLIFLCKYLIPSTCYGPSRKSSELFPILLSSVFFENKRNCCADVEICTTKRKEGDE